MVLDNAMPIEGAARNALHRFVNNAKAKKANTIVTKKMNYEVCNKYAPF